MMTERMQKYRDRMKEKGLVQVRIWVEKQDEEFVKHLAKFCREVREKKEKKRFGRRATDRQIKFAKAIAASNNISEPNHLYDHHISLAAWTWRYRSGRSDWWKWTNLTTTNSSCSTFQTPLGQQSAKARKCALPKMEWLWMTARGLISIPKFQWGWIEILSNLRRMETTFSVHHTPTKIDLVIGSCTGFEKPNRPFTEKFSKCALTCCDATPLRRKRQYPLNSFGTWCLKMKKIFVPWNKNNNSCKKLFNKNCGKAIGQNLQTKTFTVWTRQV